MQLVPTDVEVPLFTVQGIRGIVVKSTDGLDEWSAAVHRCCKLDRRSSGNLSPPLMETLLVQKHDRELLDLILFHVAGTGSAASQEGESQSGPGEELPESETSFSRMDRDIGRGLFHTW